jgi:hypothetical protein
VLLLRDGQGEESVTDIKSLIERLREHIGDAPSCPRLSCVLCEAADEMDRLDILYDQACKVVNNLNQHLAESRKAYEQVRIQSNEYQRLLCDERRKREEAEKELATLKPCAQPNPDYEWKAKYEAEQRLYSAAREVAIRLFDRECGSGKPGEAESAVDAEIEATMKEENR